MVSENRQHYGDFSDLQNAKLAKITWHFRNRIKYSLRTTDVSKYSIPFFNSLRNNEPVLDKVHEQAVGLDLQKEIHVFDRVRRVNPPSERRVAPRVLVVLPHHLYLGSSLLGHLQVDVFFMQPTDLPLCLSKCHAKSEFDTADSENGPYKNWVTKPRPPLG